MAIDTTYFVGEIHIAQLSQPAVRDTLALFIGKYSTQYLEIALGYEFAKLYAAGIAADTVEDRWTELKGGAEYNNRKGYLKKWTGFENSDKKSPIANYIFFWSTKDNATFAAGMGEMEGKSDNAKVAGYAVKQSRAWNEMVEQTWLLYDFLLNKKDGAGVLIYPEFDIKQVDCELTQTI